MATAATGMLLASKNGDISDAKLISEAPNFWGLEIEKRQVRVRTELGEFVDAKVSVGSPPYSHGYWVLITYLTR